MDIHKPKPIRNLRDFIKEIGTIVIGVSIALGAEQAMEWWHWRNQVTEARGIIATELTSNLSGAIVRVRTRDCTERRLDELSLILDEASKKGFLPPVGDISIPARAFWPTGSWESIVASQTAIHFPHRLLADIADTYKIVQRLEVISSQELLSWKKLYPIVGPGRRLDPASEAALREAISSARLDQHTMVALSWQLIDSVSNLRLRLNPDERQRLVARQNAPLSGSFDCKPIGPVAPSYGQGNAKPSETYINNALKSLRTYSQSRDE